jgi:hypothetical protein
MTVILPITPDPQAMAALVVRTAALDPDAWAELRCEPEHVQCAVLKSATTIALRQGTLHEFFWGGPLDEWDNTPARQYLNEAVASYDGPKRGAIQHFMGLMAPYLTR